MSKALPGNNKIFDEVVNYDAFMTSCILGSLWVENSRKSELLCFSSNFLEIWYRGNFEMLITERKPKLNSGKDLGKNCNFLPILAKILPSTFQQ